MPLKPFHLAPKTTTTISSSAASHNSTTSGDKSLPRIYLARTWRTPRLLLVLFTLESALTIAALALFGIASPNLYRTKLWADGYSLGYNSSPDEVLLAAANHKSFSIPLCWSQFTTTWNMVISVLSMFILIVKVVMWVMKVFWPVVGVAVHAALLAVYAFGLHAQLGSDTSDPLHENRGVPWYLTKSCKLVREQGHYGYCMQARASLAVTVLMVALFTTYTVLAMYSCLPTRSERRQRLEDSERGKLAMYKPERTTAGAAGPSATQQWGEKLATGYLQMPRTPAGGNGQFPLATPRTVAFQTLDGALVAGKGQGGTSGSLPFRERYGGPDGR